MKDKCNCKAWPSGYMAREYFWRKMKKTHKQLKSKVCGKWCLLVPRIKGQR